MAADISFVIPCYKSSCTIESVVSEIDAKMAEMHIDDYEVILVNDASPDNTFDVIRGLCQSRDNVIGIDLAMNFGQHAAIMAGLNRSSGEVVVCLDDDGQTPADEVHKLLDKIAEGYDVVYARYDQKRHSIFRNIGSRFNQTMDERMLGKPKDLYISSYFAARRFIVEEMLRYRNSYPYVIGLVLRSTSNICNVTIEHRSRQVGESGYNIKKLVSLWMNGFTSFSVLPLRIASVMGSAFALVGFIFAVWVIVNKIANPDVPIGWSSSIAATLILAGIILLVLGMLGEYVGRIYISINGSPQYVIREVVQRQWSPSGAETPIPGVGRCRENEPVVVE